MSNELLLNGMKGERHLLPGNEAIVRGALEAGVHVITCYPGTPSSEVPDAFYRRHYARFASLPCFKPATVQEAKDMTRTWPSAWPVSCSSLSCCATTMRINHMCGPVDFDDLPHISSIVKFQREPARFVPVPDVARKRHLALAAAMEKARQLAETCPFTRTSAGGPQCRTGIMASGVPRNYLADSMVAGGWEERAHILELGVTWPLPAEAVGALLTGCDRVLVLEEGAPLLEQSVRVLAQQRGLGVRVEGKDAGLEQGEYSTTLVMRRVAAFLDCPCPVKPAQSLPRMLTPRRLLRGAAGLRRRGRVRERHRLLHLGNGAAPVYGGLFGVHGSLCMAGSGFASHDGPSAQSRYGADNARRECPAFGY
ncbi:MAG: hypothetical protein LBS77_04530 [Desulfovibrio sp.]|nr:hypothetical protein [Desulfovibrio sp.]